MSLRESDDNEANVLFRCNRIIYAVIVARVNVHEVCRCAR